MKRHLDSGRAAQRLYSTKTRIKTSRERHHNLDTAHSQRLYSTKTRIKTKARKAFKSAFFTLRDYIPLKQGLRQDAMCLWYNLGILRDYIPLKQGLRRPVKRHLDSGRAAQRLYSTKTRIKTSRERHHNLDTAHSQRLYSTKTRIKTF